MSCHLDDAALYFFNEGISIAAHEALGCHRVVDEKGNRVWRFAVWAPAAKAVSVIGDFNEWNMNADPMHPVGSTGVWEAFLGFAQAGNRYKYSITAQDGYVLHRADPYAVQTEQGGTASVVAEIPKFDWTDRGWFDSRRSPYEQPISIYEVHAGSWKKGLTFRDMAHELVDYVRDMGYTHIEFMPLSEYPYEPSWGYQVTGYYAVTNRYGTPEDLMYLINRAHEQGIGVILDWVPAHFPRDAHGLRRYDGSCCYEHEDTRRSDMPQWGTLLFNYDRTQVQSFLLSNAMMWLKDYHVDGLRVDAVSCMLYLDYGKDDGQWLPNKYGGKENLSAISLLRKVSKAASELPGRRMIIAEESTAFPGVTHDVQSGGLGCTFKWNMGWMNDTLSYMEMDSYFRKWNHEKLTFSLVYAFSENFVLPFSHDEVVHGKRSLLSKMPGDYWQQFAQLRTLFAYQFAHPGKKLNFMGNEFGQFIEWRYAESLDWVLLGYENHAAMQRCVRDLNRLYTSVPALHVNDMNWNGFTWLSADDAEHSTLVWVRKDNEGGEILCAFNFTPVEHNEFWIGVPEAGTYTQIFNTDSAKYGGTGFFENSVATAEQIPEKGYNYHISIKLPPYGAVFMKYEAPAETEAPIIPGVSAARKAPAAPAPKDMAGVVAESDFTD